MNQSSVKQWTESNEETGCFEPWVREPIMIKKSNERNFKTTVSYSNFV